MEFKLEYLQQIKRLFFGNLELLKELEQAARQSFDSLPAQFYFTIGSCDGPLLDQLELDRLKGIKKIQVLLFVHELTDIEPELIEIKSQSSFQNLNQSDIFDLGKLPISDTESNVPQRSDKSMFILPKLEESQEDIKADKIEAQPPKKGSVVSEGKEESKQILILGQSQLEEKQLEMELSRLSIDEGKKERKEEEVIFDFLQCDVCKAFPFKGPAFKCLVCKQFDLCQNCEATFHHFHPTLKMTKPSHYPTSLTVAFPDEVGRKMKEELEMQEKDIKEMRRLELRGRSQPEFEEVEPASLKSKKVRCGNFLSQMLRMW